jgi:multiple sugar transport system permease protein
MNTLFTRSSGSRAKAAEELQNRPRRSLTPWIMISPSFILLFGLTAYPLIFAVRNAFHYWNLETSPVPLKFVGLANFRNVFQFTPFFASLRNTLLMSFVGISIELVFGLFIGLALASKLPYLSVVRALLIMPTTIAPMIVGFMFRYMYWDVSGIIPWFARTFHIPQPAAGYLGSTVTSLWAVLMADIWQWTPFFAIVLYAAIVSVSQEMLEAARVDGAGGIRLVWSVIIPTIKPVVVVVVLLQFMKLFNLFDVVYVLTQGGPGDSSRTLSFSLFREGLINFNIGLSAAMTIIIVAILNVLVFLYARFFMRGTRL